MAAPSFQPDLRFGFPSSEPGTGFNEVTCCHYYEALQYTGSNGTQIHCSNGDLDHPSFVAWLAKGTSLPHKIDASGTTGESLAGGLRLLFGNCAFDLNTKYRQLPFSEHDFALITKNLQLPSQFLPAMRLWTSCSFKFFCTPPSHNNFNAALCFVFKISIFRIGHYHMALSYAPTENLTYAVLLLKPFHQSAGASDFTRLLQNLSASPLFTHPLLLPVLIAELSIVESDKRFLWADEELHKLEQATGQHGWADRILGDPMALDYISATKTLNFVSRCLGVETMRVKQHLLTFEFITREIDSLVTSGVADVKEKGKRLKELVSYHVNVCENLLLRVEFQEKKVRALTAVVYQFMTQKDSKVNIELAEMTAFIARESKKDSSAMKAIAVLTMCFLPGTFLAALFAMPLFNWDENGQSIIKDSFKYYWAIAIPLTVCVLLIWAASMLLPWAEWIARMRKRMRMVDVEMADGERLKNE